MSCGVALATVMSLVPAFPGRAADLSASPSVAGDGAVRRTDPGHERDVRHGAHPGRYLPHGQPGGRGGARRGRRARHEVTVRPFWMGKLEVTWSEYDKFWLDDARRAGLVRRPRSRPPGWTRSPGPRRPTPTSRSGSARASSRVISVGTPRGHGVRAVAVPQDRQGLPAAHRGRVGIRLPRRHHDRLLVRRRPGRARPQHAWFADNSRRPAASGGSARSPIRGASTTCTATSAEWVLDLYRQGRITATRGPAGGGGPVVMPTEHVYPHVVRGGSWDHDAPAAALRRAPVLAARVEPARSASARRASGGSPTPPSWDSVWCGRVEEQKELVGLRSRVTKESP